MGRYYWALDLLGPRVRLPCSIVQNAVQRTTLQSQEAHDSEWRTRWGKAAGGAHHGPPDAPHFIESRCLAVHPCDRPTVDSVLTRHADAADGGTPTIRVDRPRRLPTMSTAFSQDFVQADRLIRRRYVQIPGKQKELLERPDAWSENLSNGPRGMINVPPDVLQDVKDFHTRWQTKLAQQPNLTQPASSAASGAPPDSSRSKQQLSSPILGQDDQADDDGATQLSWSPSPSRPPLGDRPVSPIEQPELVPPSRTPPAPWSTSLKRKTPPTPVGGGPPSSVAQSDAVPYEPLSALGEESHPPVNRGANRVAATQSILPAATPPSAQVEVVPSTLMNAGQVGSVTARPFNKRRRLDDIELSDKEHETTEQTRPPPSSHSKPRSSAPHSGRNASSTSVSTPSFPSQAAEGQHQNTALQTASATESNEQSSSHFTPTYEGRHRDPPTQQRNVLRHTASGSSMAPAPAQPPAEPTHSDLVKEPQSRFGNTAGHRTPYEEFKAAYPDYEESPGAFIRSCLLVEKLECERALPEFLYDDFIRVYSTVYMDYYNDAQIEQYSEVLKATQWYNENVKDMVYTKKIIRRDNLPAVLKAHSVTVRQTRETIREMTDDDVRVQGDQLGPDESKSEDSPASRLSPELHIPSPGPVVTTRPVMVGNDDLEEIDEPAGSPPAPSRMRQNKGTAEDDLVDDSLRVDIAAHEDSQRSRASPELNFHEPETVLNEKASLKVVTQGIESTPAPRKSPTASQTRRNAPTPAASTPKSGTGQRRLLGALPSSSPSNVTASMKGSAKDKSVSPPTKNTARQSSPVFISQVESSDDESDSFDPPVAQAAMLSSRSEKSNVPAFLTQAQSVYEIPGTPDRLSEEPVPSPSSQAVAKTSAVPQSLTVSGRTASTAIAATAVKSDEAVQREVPACEGVASRLSMGSNIRAKGSPASSDRSRASVPLFKKRVGETQEERSKRLKEHIRKRLSRKTPSSTAASTK